MTQSGSNTRTARRRRRNREALLRAARGLMAERGFTRTTIADITEEADLGFGTFYLYFRNKADVLEAVLQEGLSDMLSQLNEPSTDRLPPWDALRLVMVQFAGGARDNTDLFAIVFRDGPGLLRSVWRVGDAFTRRLQAILERGAREGVMRPVPAALVARALTGLFVQALLWRDEAGLRTADEIVEVLFPIARQGLLVREGAAEALE